jgi:hypothetical protein
MKKRAHAKSAQAGLAATVRERRARYGDPRDEFARVATIWSAVLGQAVTPGQVGLCLIGLKLAREAHEHNRDNLVDACGYAQCTAELFGEALL